MAKKKSKTAKQKQNKAKSLTKKRKQISSKYNVPFLNQSKNNNNGDVTLFVKKVNGKGGGNNNNNSHMKTPYNSPMNTGGGGTKGINMIVDKRKLRNAAILSSISKSCAENTETQDFMKSREPLESNQKK